MPAYKNKERGTWYVKFYSKNWMGKNKQVKKEGFSTKKEALDYERNYKLREARTLDITLSEFFEIYTEDKRKRLKENTWITKEYIVRDKILPYLGHMKMNEIRPAHIVQWQNEVMKLKTDTGEDLSQCYLKTIHNQLSCILNHAIRYYDLNDNAARKAGNMGKEEKKEMLFWTKDEYYEFSKVMMNKDIAFYAFEMLYFTGMRVGELLALTMEDFNFFKKTVRINKSYQRIKGKDVITSPKTLKSNRVIYIPSFLVDEMQEYFSMLYKHEKNQRIFEVTRSFLHHEMDRGCEKSGVKRIRIHDLRHAYVKLLLKYFTTFFVIFALKGISRQKYTV